jgi:glycopeptide antibiotics resistance protein
MTKKAVLWAVFWVYLAVLLRITVFRSGFGSHGLFSGEIVWIPFQDIFSLVKTSLGYFLYLFVGNIIWFVPFGFLLPRLIGWGAQVIGYTFLLSLVIETLQFIFGTGVSEVEDLILNTLGGSVGYGIVWMLRRKKA